MKSDAIFDRCRPFFALPAIFLAGWLDVASGAPPQGSEANRTELPGGFELAEGHVASTPEVRIHYVTAGTGPLVVLIHGFADYWYTWRYQIPVLAQHYRVVAIDLRGYNLSSQPEEVDQYETSKLMGDLTAVLDHFEARRAILVGHDWGGFLAWEYAMRHPKRVARLVVLGAAHPQAAVAALKADPHHAERTAGASRKDRFSEETLMKWTPTKLAAWVRDPLDRQQYVEMFERTSVQAMANHYRARYRSPDESRVEVSRRRVECPVFLVQGLRDRRVRPELIEGTWRYVGADLTVCWVPRTGHVVHRELPNWFNRRLLGWLGKPVSAASEPRPHEGGATHLPRPTRQAARPRRPVRREPYERFRR